MREDHLNSLFRPTRESSGEIERKHEVARVRVPRIRPKSCQFPVYSHRSGKIARGLRDRPAATTSDAMISREQLDRFIDHPVVEWSIFGIGVLLLIASPLVGAIPGPGGLIVAGIGLAMVLKTSMWAKRRYVQFKRWQPKAGRWTDWALRRRSAKRREQLGKAEQSEPGN